MHEVPAARKMPFQLPSTPLAYHRKRRTDPENQRFLGQLWIFLITERGAEIDFGFS